MTYEFRHDFMANAVDEATTILNLMVGQRFITYSWMRQYWTNKERNDWFAMYAMGGIPYPAYRARGL